MPRRSLKPMGLVVPFIVVFLAAAAWFGFHHNAPSTVEKTTLSEKLMLAEKLLERGAPDKALTVIEEIRADKKYRALAEEVDLLRLKALDQAGESDELAAAAEQYLEDYPESAQTTTVELIRLSAEVASAGLSRPELLRSVEEFVAEHPDHAGVGRLQLALAQREIAVGDVTAAHRRLEGVLSSDQLDDEVAADLRGKLGELNRRALFTGSGAVGDDQIHLVEQGDSIWLIARKYGVTGQLLIQANNIKDPKMLRIGQAIRVPNVDFSLECDINDNVLNVYNHGRFFCSYPVRTGRTPGTTPTGEYTILNKKENPVWRPGNGYVYSAGDPNNELGTRWMAFEGDLLGIHGTIHPETLGHYASNGCIGMAKEEVEELFDMITVGTSLRIVGQQDLASHKVIPAREIPPPRQQRELAQNR